MGAARLTVVRVADRRLPDQATVWVVDALTCDTLATGRAGADGRYTTHVAGPRPVKLLVEAKFGPSRMTGWHAVTAPGPPVE